MTAAPKNIQTCRRITGTLIGEGPASAEVGFVGGHMWGQAGFWVDSWNPQWVWGTTKAGSSLGLK